MIKCVILAEAQHQTVRDIWIDVGLVASCSTLTVPGTVLRQKVPTEAEAKPDRADRKSRERFVTK